MCLFCIICSTLLNSLLLQDKVDVVLGNVQHRHCLRPQGVKMRKGMMENVGGSENRSEACIGRARNPRRAGPPLPVNWVNLGSMAPKQTPKEDRVRK